MLSRSPQQDAPTLGPTIIRWMETNLVYGPGDLQGKPYQVDPFLHPILNDLYRYNPKTGRRTVRRALIGVAKGNTKSEFAAAVGLVELAGPCLIDPQGNPTLRNDPDIIVAAASYEQADLVYSAARTMSEPIWEFMDGPYDTQMLLADDPGRLYRVAAVQGANDGKRPTCVICDELHEWVDNKERVHTILTNGLTKRQDSLELSITTAGHRLESVCGNLYQYGKRVASGEVVDPSFVFYWWEADDTYQPADLDDPVRLREATRQANPASFIDIERVVARYEVDRLPPYEYMRYYWNRWTSADKQWLPVGAWPILQKRRVVEEGEPITLGFDGSYNGDSTALVGCTLDGHIFAVGIWENPGDPDWRVPRHEVMVAVDQAFTRWQVLEMACDPFGWVSELGQWEDQYGVPPITQFATNQRTKMAEACSRFYTAVLEEEVTNDGDVRMFRHFENAVVKETPDGAYIVKDGRESPRKIDAAVAAVIAYDRSMAYIEASDPSIMLI